MTDQVEISNVGGDGGVASEATLASLSRAIEKLAASSGKDPTKEAGKVQQAHNDAVRSGITVSTKNRDALEQKTKSTEKATKATNMYSRALLGAATGAVGAVAGSLTAMADALVSGQEDITSFAQQVPLIGKGLGILTGIIDGNIDSFRQLSQVGALFGGSLNDLRNMSASAGLPLDEFTSLVTQNSESMKLFGAGTMEGARNFAAMSKQLRDGPGKAFIAMGFTAQELNESLIEYAEFSQTQIGIDRRNNRMSAESAANYLQTIDQLAAVTGKRRDQIKAEMTAAMDDQRARLAMSRMNEEQQAQFAANLAAGPESLREALTDMADGVANNELTQGLMVASETFRRQAGDIENMNASEYNNFLARVGRELDAAGNELGEGAQAIINSGGAFGSAIALGADLKEFENLTAEEAARLQEERLKAQQTDEGIKGFSDTIRDIRTSLMETLTTGGANSPLSLVANSINSVAETLRDFVSSEAFKSGLKNLSDTITTFIENFKNFDLSAAIFGGKRTVTEEGPNGETLEREVDVEGLLPPDLLKSIMSSIGSALKEALLSNAGVIVAGIVGVFAASKVVSAVASGLSSVVGGMFSSGDSTRSSSNRGKRGGMDRAGAGIGGFLGNLGAGVMTGAAKGLAAFANPAVPIGAAALGAAVTVIGAGIAGASWIMGKTLPTFAEGLKSFEDIDGSALVSAGKGMAAVAAGMAAFGAGSAVSGLGNLVGSVTEGLVSLFGGDTPMEKMQQFAEYDIDAERVRRNAEAMVAFGTAMAAQGAGAGLSGVGNLVGAIGDFVSGLFGGESPIDQVKAFGDMQINAEGVRANADAMVIMSRALSAMSGTDASDVEIPRSLVNRLRDLSEIQGGGLTNVASGMTAIANVQGLQSNLDVLNTGLDIDKVRNYNEVMRNLVDTLEDLNETLAEDNEGMFGGGTGVASADVIQQMQNTATGSGPTSDQLNSTMQQILMVLMEIRDLDIAVKRNTRNISTSNIATGSVSSIGY